MNPKIIFEDEYFLIIDKPAGMTVNRAETTKGQETVQDWVEKEVFNSLDLSKIDQESDFIKRSGTVHRLDKETSGLLIIAKTPKAFEELQRQFKERQIKKKYLALVHGQVIPEEGMIEATIARNPFNREKFGIFLGGREAKTKYKRINKGELIKEKEKFSLLELYPETGRTHQIRVHLKFINHPIVSDEKYAGRKTVRKDRQWCPRLFLHAAGLSFEHPLKEQKVELSLKLPSDLELAMMKLISK
ncbi:MAG: RluA family pseudouridine synthase [Candidatus Shapirobacteria bacterium]|nr:RluA family pseudouridine synthase [Candidatus Shapirobacteria bacterium]